MRRAVAVVLALLATVALAGCAETAPTAIPATPTGVPSPPSPQPTVVPPTVAPGPSASRAPSGGAVEDPSLLDLLPADVEGIPVVLEHEAFLEAVADPAFAENVRGAAFGVATEGTDLVSGVVAQLVDGRFNDAFFRDWRDTYNAGACERAGGVVGNAETDIDGRTVYIATCAGGVRVYHVWVPERGAIVSAFALGERRLGEALMEGLRP